MRLYWPSVCVLVAFFRLFDAMNVSRMISRLYFLVFSLDFFLIFLHISAYSSRCLSSPIPTNSFRFVIRARVGDDILDFSGLSNALATFVALCWIKPVMFSRMVSMSSSS